MAAPLLRNPNKRVSRFHYNFQQIKSKGAILVLVWDVLALNLTYHSALSFLYTTPEYSIVFKVFRNIFLVFYLLYPLGGLIANVWTSCYKVIIVSAYICFLAWIICDPQNSYFNQEDSTSVGHTCNCYNCNMFIMQ